VIVPPDPWTAVHARELAAHTAPAPDWASWRARFAFRPDPGTSTATVTIHAAVTSLAAGQFPGPPGFDLHEGWSRIPYRLVWVSRQQRSVVAFVEGDLLWSHAVDEAAYEQLHQRCRDFYRHH
jgi:hypothetical protein